MKTKIFNKRLEFGAFLIKKLENYFESYYDIYKDLYNLREDYRMSAIIGSGPFFYMF